MLFVLLILIAAILLALCPPRKAALCVAVLLPLILAGCTSTKAQGISQQHATFNKDGVILVAGYANQQTNELADVAASLQQQLDSAHEKKIQANATSKEKALAARDELWMRKLATIDWASTEKAKAKTYKDALNNYAQGFDQQVQMKELEASIPKQLAKDSLEAAVKAAPKIYGALAPSVPAPAVPASAFDTAK